MKSNLGFQIHFTCVARTRHENFDLDTVHSNSKRKVVGWAGENESEAEEPEN